jgi:hypothetical protein
MVENKEYVPTLTEWDELSVLWARSRAVLSSTLGLGAMARIAWTTKQFIDAHPDVAGRSVYAWLEKNLEIASRSAPFPRDTLGGTQWHEEPTVVLSKQRAPRGTPHEHIKIDPTFQPKTRRPGVP